MSLPTRAMLDDIDAVCGYLVTKPTGATLAETRAVVDRRHLDRRKVAALKFWGLIEYDGNGSKMKITDRGRRSVKDSGSKRSEVLREVVGQIGPYKAMVERVVHGGEETIAATDVAARWYEHFKGEVADSDEVLNEQAICFFQLAQGADLGKLVIGRRGQPTRFDFDADAARAFVEGVTTGTPQGSPEGDSVEDDDPVADPAGVESTESERGEVDDSTPQGNRVFITHGKNRKILDQVKQLVAYGKYEPVVAIEHETPAKPVPQKVMDEMRTCRAAVIHVSAERVLYDRDRNEVPQINENVLIEIGAAMALYRDKFVLLVEEGVNLPSNIQGLYECRYQGEELKLPAIMKLLEAFSEF